MRRFGIAVGVVVAVLLGGVAIAWVALQSIDWNDYKAPLVRAVQDATGRRLDLAGDLSLQIGLKPGVRIEAVRFENADWGSREQMVTLERLVVRLELLPLLSGEVVVDRVDLIGLDVLLETNPDGLANWEFDSATGSAPESETVPDQGDADNPLSTLLRRARIENATLVIRDARTGTEQRVAIERLLAQTQTARGPLSLDLKASYGGSPIELHGELTGVSGLLSGAPLGVDLELSVAGAKGQVQGQVGVPLEGRALDLALKLAGDSLRGFEALAGAALPDLGPYSVSMKLTGGADHYRVEDLDLQVGESRVTGSVNIDLSRSRPRIDAKLTSPLLDAADFQESPAESNAQSEPSEGSARVFSADPLPLESLGVVDADITLKADTLRSGALVFTDTQLRIRLVDRRLRVEPFQTVLARGRVSASVSLDGSRRAPRVAVSAAVRGLVVGDLLRAQGNETVTDGPLDLDLAVEGSGSSVRQIMAGLSGSLGIRMGPAVVNNQWAGLALSDVSSLVDMASTDRGAEVSCVLADFEIRDGVVRPDGWVVDLGSLALFGDGKVDLGDERIRLRFDRQGYSASLSQVLPPFEVKGTLAEPEGGIDASAVAGHVLDLASGLMGGGDKKKSSEARPASCPGLLASYRAAGEGPDSTEEVAAKAADLIGGKLGKKGKKIVDGLKGLFGR